MSPVTRQYTNEQKTKVATRIPCCAGCSLCAARLQKKQWVNPPAAAILHCQMHVSSKWQIVNFANTVRYCCADAVLSKRASKSQTDTNCKKHMVGSICQQSEQAGTTMQSQDGNPVTDSMLAAPDVLG